MGLIQRPRRFRRRGWIVLAAFLLAVILAGIVGTIVTNLHAQEQPHYQSAVGTPVFVPPTTPTPTPLDPGSTIGVPPLSPISGPPGKGTSPHLPADIGVVYTSQKNIYLLRNDTAEPERLNAPGYDSLVAPLLTNDGRLLYAGDGLYLADLVHNDTTPPLQIASIDTATQVIASMTISSDGQQVFWSVEPHNGNGAISFYEATITPTGASQPTQIYSQPANICPCYMIFGLGLPDANGAPTLLLTDNLGTPADQGTGLWSFDPAQQQIGPAVLAEAQGQAPLTLSPDSTHLAFAPTTGEVPEPTDNSVPLELGSNPYGNSLSVTSWSTNGPGNPVSIVSPQTNVHTISSYHWIASPVFSPDSQSLAYIQFSSDNTGPYDRHSTLYLASVDGSSPPAPVAVFSARLVELGTWLDSHTLLLYADGGIYAIDTHTAAISLLSVAPDYSQIIGLLHVTEQAPANSGCHPQCAR